jgi:hypothetical protein
MKAIEAFITADGKVHTDAGKAKAHELDLLGAELDGLLMHVFGLDINRYSQHSAILKAMKQRTELKKTIAEINRILCHEGEE